MTLRRSVAPSTEGGTVGNDRSGPSGPSMAKSREAEVSEGFDPGPARSGLTHIELAFTRWSEFLDVHPPRPMSHSVAARQSLHANSYLVDLVRWIRAVDDHLRGHGRGPGEGPGLPSYILARADPAVAGPLDALRYAANKSLHLLTVLAAAPAVYVKGTGYLGTAPPPPPRRPHEPVYLWPDLAHLPIGRRGDQHGRDAYAEHLASREIDPILNAVVTWLHTSPAGL